MHLLWNVDFFTKRFEVKVFNRANESLRLVVINCDQVPGRERSLHHRQGSQEPVPGLQAQEMSQHGDEQRR